MPANTPNRGYPYPLGIDPIAISADIEKLARAIDTSDASQQTQIDGVLSTNTGQQNQLNDLYSRHDIVAYQTNSYEIPTVANGWATYGLGTFTLPAGAGVIYKVLTQVGLQVRSDGGGYIRMLQNHNNGGVAVNGQSFVTTLSGQSVFLINSAYTVYGPGDFTIQAVVLTQNTGYMGPGWATMVATIQ
jgi:hypothetical protein